MLLSLSLLFWVVYRFPIFCPIPDFYADLPAFMPNYFATKFPVWYRVRGAWMGGGRVGWSLMGGMEAFLASCMKLSVCAI